MADEEFFFSRHFVLLGQQAPICLSKLSSVNIFPVPYDHNKNDESVVKYFINDSISANPDSPGVSTAQLLAASRPWIFCEQLNRGNDSILVLEWNF
jgi:hypothetical protein